MENLPGVINLKPFAPSLLNKKGSRLSENEKAERLTNNERKKCRNTQNISLDVIYFLRCLQGKKNFIDTLPRSRRKFERTSTRSKRAKNFKIFCLNILNF